jgi:hypothetical protein
MWRGVVLQTYVNVSEEHAVSICSPPVMYCHVSQWLKTGFGLVIEINNNLQVVTTINYYTVIDFYSTKHSTLIFSVYLH